LPVSEAMAGFSRRMSRTARPANSETLAPVS
jgi:hypothetical protein